MPCNAMHPIQDLFLEGFSYLLQIDMHFICTSMLARFYFCKKWVLQKLNFGLFPWANPTRVVWWDAKFDSIQFQKKVPQSKFVCKSYDRFTEARPGCGSGRQNMTRNRNWVRHKLAVCDSNG
jgi:Leu/Phe-tRNA-protein transferase